MGRVIVVVTDFLLACFAEDEAVLREPQFANLTEPIDLHQLTLDYAAKRRIVEMHYMPEGTDWCMVCVEHNYDNTPWPCPTIRALAAVYADHPDYDPEWCP